MSWTEVALVDVCKPKQWKTIPISALKKEGYPVYDANGVIGFYDEFNHLEETLMITCRGATCYILTTVGGETKPITVEEYRERLAESLVNQVTNLTLFRSIWVQPEERGKLLQILPDGGRSASIIRTLDELEACDLFDVLGELGYGLHRLTRLERAEAFSYKQEDWLREMPEETAATVRAIASQFGKSGTEGLENKLIFQVPEVIKAGGLSALKLVGKPSEIIQEAKIRLFAA